MEGKGLILEIYKPKIPDKRRRKFVFCSRTYRPLSFSRFVTSLFFDTNFNCKLFFAVEFIKSFTVETILHINITAPIKTRTHGNADEKILNNEDKLNLKLVILIKNK